jgi:hypothetical protein
LRRRPTVVHYDNFVLTVLGFLYTYHIYLELGILLCLLIVQVWKLYENENLISLVDESLDPEEYKPEEVKRIIEIALLCTQSAVASRPTMSEIVVLLLTKNSPELQPTRPTFIDSTSRVRGETSSSSSSSASKATVSFTQFSAR